MTHKRRAKGTIFLKKRRFKIQENNLLEKYERRAARVILESGQDAAAYRYLHVGRFGVVNFAQF